MSITSIVNNKSNKYSKEQKSLIEQNEKELTSKLDRKIISKNSYPKEFDVFDEDTKKALRKKYKEYKEVIIKQETFEGQYISDNDIKNLARLVILEYKEQDLDYRILTTLDIDEENKLATMLAKVSKEIRGIKKKYPLDAESIKEFSRDINTEIKEQDTFELMLKNKLEKKKQRQQEKQKEKVGE